MHRNFQQLQKLFIQFSFEKSIHQMKFLNLRYVSTIDISINSLGFTQLNKMAHIIEFCSGLQYILFFWIFFQKIFSFLGISNYYLLVTQSFGVYILICVMVSLVYKIVSFYALYQIQYSLLCKKLSYCILILSEQCLFFLDTALVYYSKDCLKDTEFNFVIISMSILNLLLCLILKIINHIIAVNCTFISQNPYKQRQNFIHYIIKQLFLILIIIQEQIYNNLTIYSILSTMCIFILYQFRYQLITIPYTFNNISYIKLIKASGLLTLFISSILCLFFTLMAQNFILLFCVLLFFIVYASQSFRLLKKQNLLNLQIQEMENSQQSSIKLQNYLSLLTETSNQAIVKLTGYLNKHQNQCLNIDCICKRKDRLQNISISRTIEKDKIFAKYFLLQLSYQNKEKFSYFLEPQILYISSLALLHLYPKMYTEIVLSEEKYQQDICFTHRNMFNFLKIKISNDILERNKNFNSVCIEQVKYYQIKLNKLRQMIGGYCKNKYRTWLSLYKGNLQISFFEELLKIDYKGRQSIIQLYQQLIEISFSSKLWRMMLTFTKLVVRDISLERSLMNGIKKASEKLESIHINGRIISLVQNPNVALLKVSSELKNIGMITWCSANLFRIFGFSAKHKVVGENIDMLMPKIYKIEHNKIMRRWFQNPTQKKKINKFTEIYISTNENEYNRAVTYIKILPLLDSFELIAAIYSIDQQQETLILDQNLDLINNPIFINDILSKKGLILKQKLDISLISADFIDYCNIAQSQKHQLTLNIKLPKDYDNIYNLYRKAYQNIVKQTQEKIQLYERIKSLKLYYNSIIQMRRQMIQIVLDIQIRKQQIGDANYYFLKYIECDLVISINNIQKNRLSATNISIFNDGNSDESQFQNSEIHLMDEKNSYCSMTSQFTTIKMKKYISLGQLQSKNLNIIKIIGLVTIICLVICVIIRMCFLSVNVETYNDLCSADSNISDTMQLSEFIYDYSIILYSQRLKQRLSDEDINYYANQSLFVGNYILNLAEMDNLQQIRKNLLTNVNIVQYLHQLLNISIGSDNLAVSNNNFLKELVVNAKNVLQVLSTSSNISQVHNQINFMSNNFEALMMMNHYLIQKYQDLGSVTLKHIQIFTNIIYPIQLLISILFIFYLNIYLYRKHQVKIEFLNIFMEIPENKVNNYSNYFQICYKKFDTLTENDFEHLKLKKKSLKDKKTISPFKNFDKQYYIKFLAIIFLLLIICSTVSTVQTKIFNYPAYFGMTYMNDIMDSQNFLIEGIIRLRQMLLNITDNSKINLKKLSQTFSQTQVIFLNAANNIQKLIQQYLPDAKFQLLKLYINDTCSIDSDILLDWQLDNCNQIASPILQSGSLSSMNYFQRIIYEKLSILANNNNETTKQKLLSDNDLQIADKTMFYLFRIFQKIQTITLRMISKQSNGLLNIIYYLTIINLIILLSLLLIGLKISSNQNKEYIQTCKYLLCIPDEQFRENKQIQLTLTRILKKHSLDPKNE